jgi:O-antigen/teichoic acid export membrane protein
VKINNIKNITSFASKSEFRKNLLVLMSGTAIAQIIPVLCSPVLTRQFSPADFGLYANFTAVMSFITIVMTGQYPKAIVLPEKNEDAINVLAIAVLLAIACTGILIPVFALAGKPLAVLFQSPSLGSLLWLIPVCALLYAVYEVFNEWCIRRKWFGKLGRNKISNTSGIAGSQMLLGFAKVSEGLVFGEIVGRIFSSILAVWRVLSNDQKLFSHVSWCKMKYFARKYIDFPKYTVPSQFLNTVAGQLPVLGMTVTYGTYEIGLFALGNRILSTPSIFLGNAFMDVFKQKAAEEYRNKGNCLVIYKKSMWSILKVSIIPFLLIFIFSPVLFSWIFGQEWYEAGIYARIMSVNAWLSFIFVSTSSVFYVANGQRKLLVWQIIYSIATVLSLTGCFFFSDIKVVLVGLCIFKSVANIIGINFTYRLARNKNDKQ